MARNLVFAKPGLVSLPNLSEVVLRSLEGRTYEDETTHHVHAGAEAAEQEDLVTGDHPLSAGL